MEHAFTAWAAWISLAATVSAGYFGLRMCKAMLLPVTPGNLRLEADIRTLQLVNSYLLSSHQSAQVLRALYASEPTPASSTLPVRLAGSRNLSLLTKKRILTPFGSPVDAAASALFSESRP